MNDNKTELISFLDLSQQLVDVFVFDLFHLPQMVDGRVCSKYIYLFQVKILLHQIIVFALAAVLLY